MTGSRVVESGRLDEPLRSATLCQLRSEIDRLDREMLVLLRRRMELARLTRRFKAETVDREREKRVIEWARGAAGGALRPEAAERLFQVVISESRSLQESGKPPRSGGKKTSIL